VQINLIIVNCPIIGTIPLMKEVTPMPGAGTTKDENGVVAIMVESR
jgi:hypothetical protein